MEEDSNRRVGLTENPNGRVSTVFLGIDHRFNFEDGGAPVVFETMVFGGTLDGEMERYCTKTEALEGHTRMVARVKGGTGLNGEET